MHSAQITGVREGGVTTVADPKIAENFVKVRVTVAPLCTEYKAYKEGHVTNHLGHEAAGEVVEVAQPGKVKPGDRVVVMPGRPCGECDECLSGHYIHCTVNRDPRTICQTETGMATLAEYVIAQDWMVLKIPDDLSYEHASMACCGLGPTFGATRYMGVNTNDTVLITGMGPVGLGGVINATYLGARVIAVDSHPYRKALAAELGAAHVVDPTDGDAADQILEITGGRGAEYSIDCSGVAAAQRLLIDCTRRLGTVSFVGEAGDLTIHVSRDMIRKGLNLHGAWHWKRTDESEMMNMIRAVGDKLDKHVTHTFKLDEIAQAWELQMTGNCGKVLIYP
jgi:threonine dehydrogenase-like Zn-dependent dehydrogenase